MTESGEDEKPVWYVSRRETRSPTRWTATIRFLDGTEIPCNLKNVSKSGAKVGVPADQVLPPVFMLRIIDRDFLCLVKLAWRHGDYAGVRIEKIGKVPAHPPGDSEATEVVASRDAQQPGGVGVLSRERSHPAF